MALGLKRITKKGLFCRNPCLLLIKSGLFCYSCPVKEMQPEVLLQLSLAAGSHTFTSHHPGI